MLTVSFNNSKYLIISIKANNAFSLKLLFEVEKYWAKVGKVWLQPIKAGNILYRMFSHKIF